jgi:hypothetical protein
VSQFLLGEHAARLDAIERKVDALHADVREIRDVIAGVRGSAKALAWAGGMAGAVIGALATVLLGIAKYLVSQVAR